MFKILIISLLCFSTNAISYSLNIQKNSAYSEYHGGFEQDLDSKLVFEDSKTGLKGFQNDNGEVLVPALYKHIISYGNRSIFYALDCQNNWLLKNLDTKVSRHMMTDDNGADCFYLGLARYLNQKKIGFVNQQGDVIIDAQYDYALPFDFNAPMTIVGQHCQTIERNTHYGCDCGNEIKCKSYGAIDSTGRIIVPLNFDNYEISCVNQFESDKKKTIIFYKNNQKFYLYRLKNGDFVLKSSELR